MGRDFGFNINGQLEVVRSVRPQPPAHYKFEIQSFSSIRKDIKKDDYIESTEFTVGNHTWTMSIYLDGNSKDGVQGFLSLYLNKVIKKPGDEDPLHVSISFFIYDYIGAQFLKIQDSSVSEYDESNHTCGIASALNTTLFDKASNGFVKSDRCTFGVELLYHSTDAMTASLAPVRADSNGSSYSWLTNKYSSLGTWVLSPAFKRFGRAWKLKIYPNGLGKAEGKFLSMYLNLQDANDLKGGMKLFIKYEITLKNMDPEKDLQKSGFAKFSSPSDLSYGFTSFISLNVVRDTKKGFLMGGALSATVTIKSIFLLKAT